MGAQVTRMENFRQKQVQRFDSMYMTRARNHNIGRNEAVVELICYLSFLRNLSDIPQGAQVAASGAHIHAIRGGGPDVGAHCLPCQIVVVGQVPWVLVRSQLIDATKLKSDLQHLFRRGNLLPKVFNVADKWAEDNCLVGALVRACQVAIDSTRPVHREGGVLKQVGGTIVLWLKDRPAAATAGVDRNAVKDAYAVWKQQAQNAYETALARVSAEGASCDGADVTDDVIYILSKYREGLHDPPAKLLGSNIAKLEEDLWV